MTFEELVDQAMAMLERRGRVTYRALKRQFQLDDDVLEDLTAEIIKAQRLAVDEGGEVLVWTGALAGAGSAPAPTQEPVGAPHAYTPPHLAEKILTSKAALEGERKQVTVLFADLKGSMELLADRDPEEARQLLDPVLERIRTPHRDPRRTVRRRRVVSGHGDDVLAASSRSRPGRGGGLAMDCMRNMRKLIKQSERR
jgi:hypothetical protein